MVLAQVQVQPLLLMELELSSRSRRELDQEIGLGKVSNFNLSVKENQTCDHL